MAKKVKAAAKRKALKTIEMVKPFTNKYDEMVTFLNNDTNTEEFRREVAMAAFDAYRAAIAAGDYWAADACDSVLDAA